MEIGRHVYLGEAAKATRSHSGRHREFGTEKAIGLIPLGDRSRDIPEYGVDYIEERNGVDISTSRRR